MAKSINGAITKKVKNGMTQSKAIGQVYSKSKSDKSAKSYAKKEDKSPHAKNKFHASMKKHVSAGKTPARSIALAHQGRTNGKKK